MYRYVAMAVFILPKLVVWPLMWYWRCQRKKKLKAENHDLLEEGRSHCPDYNASSDYF
ncbi:hypothetical protein [Dethiobacter alkaliphilus]|uniref:Uncharacterized protein n=1 Tax=Dethiobacter alkaliphilus AHT 1 TaxID=555088 RepID=C0GKN1_DETAL|nr:hypothetical protein [Dethiobacter alkaliphilus]EEG76123.1 hypothetical protein DealDRAFT_3040 [Dethiobacter alkaliphilus AHT 1]MCW3489607.1 hypothetical protein [Dethiobacter alkaliphilus]